MAGLFSLLPALIGRSAVVAACAVATMMVVDAVQDRLLPPAGSFDAAFDRLGQAAAAGAVAGLIAAGLCIRLRARRLPLATRIALSVLAVLLPVAGFLIVTA